MSAKYDAIIIGAGIGGLVCGCYLAKAGMKVLICEQHYKPGGYCTSFKRKGFNFDAAVHSFGGYRKDGIVRKVFTELGIDKIIKIKKYDPSDIIIAPDFKISFCSDLNKTIETFQTTFPNESYNIENFFSFLIDQNPLPFVSIRNWTFKDLLDKYFTNEKLKATLSFPLFGNTGLPPSLLSAFLAAKLFKEFLIDGGYYPEGGMQVLSDMLAKKFQEYGGELLLSCPVRKIIVKNGEVRGIVTKEDDFITSKTVISNCDATQTFINLLGEKIISRSFLNKIKNMIPSLSMFVIYLGIDKYFKTLPKPGSNLWFLPHYDIEDMYLSAKNRNTNNLAEYMIRVSPDKKTILIFINANFKNKRYWDANKKIFLNSLIERIERFTIPGLSEHIVHKDAATPYTFYRYSLNHKGSAYGWAGIPSQLADPDFRRPQIKGLYLTGHWTLQGMGIPSVFYSGLNTANFLIKGLK